MDQLIQYLTKLKELGKRKGDFAREIGVSQATLSQYLSGVRRPSYDVMLKIAAATNGRVPLSAWASQGPSRNIKDPPQQRPTDRAPQQDAHQ